MRVTFLTSVRSSSLSSGAGRVSNAARNRGTSTTSPGVSRPSEAHPHTLPVWNALEAALTKAHQRTGLDEIIRVVMVPPYGVKAGVVPLLVVTALIVRSEDVALFEDGSYLPRLTPDEVHHYIRTRLRIAGAPDLTIFSERAVRAIGEYANGVPRLVNVLCDHCLVLGYAGQTRRIERDLVVQAIEYLEEGIPHGRSRALRPSRPGWVAARRWLAAGVAGAALGTVLGLSGGTQTLVDASSGLASSMDRWFEVIRELVAR